MSMVTTAAKAAAELVAYQARKNVHERDDRDALGALESVSLELPQGLRIEWLGVAGYRLIYEGQTLLIDPFVSRFPLASFLRRRTTLPDPELVAAFDAQGSVAGIVCGHAHWDHSLDIPAFTRRFDARAFGSASLANQMTLHGLRGLAETVAPNQRYEFGPFTVSFTPSKHAKVALGVRVPMDSDTSVTSLRDLTPQQYRCGQVWGIRIEVAGVVIYHQGSADLIDAAIRGGNVDILLAGVAGRQFTPNYWERLLPLLRPSVVVPMHYDNFFSSVSEEQMTFVPQAHLSRVPDEISAVGRSITVAALPRVR